MLPLKNCPEVKTKQITQRPTSRQHRNLEHQEGYPTAEEVGEKKKKRKLHNFSVRSNMLYLQVGHKWSSDSAMRFEILNSRFYD